MALTPRCPRTSDDGGNDDSREADTNLTVAVLLRWDRCCCCKLILEARGYDSDDQISQDNDST
jgi:hypothetical protein